MIPWEVISGTSLLNLAKLFAKSSLHAEAWCEWRLCQLGKPCLGQHSRGKRSLDDSSQEAGTWNWRRVDKLFLPQNPCEMWRNTLGMLFEPGSF